jgi:class 3 adenylate cyclase
MLAMSFTMPIPDNEEERLKKLEEYNIMDTAPELVFDEITELAAELLDCPVSFIQFMNEDRQWFKAKYGVPDDFIETPRDASVCATTICQNDLLLVPDLTQDERFSELPGIKSEPNLRFYAGMPLITPSGHAIGSICTVDFKTRELSGNQQEALRRLSHQVVTQLELRRTVIEMDQAIKSRDQLHEELSNEKARSDELLLNILPSKVANELKETDKVEPRFYNSVSIMFGDFCGFTKLAEQMEPKSLIDLLNQYFSAFDKIVTNHNVEKIKTIGDAYMCASGLPAESRGHALRICLAALEIQHYLKRANEQREKMRMARWDMRIGIHTGPVIAGVVGERKFTYDIWGDAVNVAALIEQGGEPEKVTISETTFQQVKEAFETEALGEVASGKKGDLSMYTLKRLIPEFSEDTDGLKPNDVFDQKFANLMKVYQT